MPPALARSGWIMSTACRSTSLLKSSFRKMSSPILTGEDIFLKEDFNKLVDLQAVDMIHPDLASAGGILETKKIGDYAQERAVASLICFSRWGNCQGTMSSIQASWCF